MKAVKICFFLSFLFCSSVFTEECGKTFKLNYIDTLVVKCPAEVIIKQGETNEYCFSGDPETISQIKVDLDTGGDLKFIPRSSVDHPSMLKPIFIYVTAKDLQNITLGDKVQCVIQGFSARKIVLVMDGHTEFKATMDVQEFHVKVSGESKITLRGSAQRQKVHFEGTGYYDATQFPTKEVVAHFEGKVEVFFKVFDMLNIVSSGESVITYSGNPTTVKSHIKGGVLKRI